jgi:hypothetical protein
MRLVDEGKDSALIPRSSRGGWRLTWGKSFGNGRLKFLEVEGASFRSHLYNKYFKKLIWHRFAMKTI